MCAIRFDGRGQIAFIFQVGGQAQHFFGRQRRCGRAQRIGQRNGFAGARFAVAIGQLLFGGVEIEEQLSAGGDEAIALAQQETAAAHNDGQLRQRPFDAGHVAPQFGQLAFDGRGRCAGGQQFGQSPGGGDFLKIEVRQAADFAGRMDQSTPMPAADHRHGDVEQLGEHRRRVQATDLVFFVDQAEPLPELAFADQLRYRRLRWRLAWRRRTGRRELESVGSGNSSPTTISWGNTVAGFRDSVEELAISTGTPPARRISCWASRFDMPARRPTKAIRRPLRWAARESFEIGGHAGASCATREGVL